MYFASSAGPEDVFYNGKRNVYNDKHHTAFIQKQVQKLCTYRCKALGGAF